MNKNLIQKINEGYKIMEEILYELKSPAASLKESKMTIALRAGIDSGLFLFVGNTIGILFRSIAALEGNPKFPGIPGVYPLMNNGTVLTSDQYYLEKTEEFEVGDIFIKVLPDQNPLLKAEFGKYSVFIGDFKSAKWDLLTGSIMVHQFYPKLELPGTTFWKVVLI
jgi:hypothetical protein